MVRVTLTTSSMFSMMILLKTMGRTRTLMSRDTKRSERASLMSSRATSSRMRRLSSTGRAGQRDMEESQVLA